MASNSRRVLLQIGLFIVTFICTTIAGTEWVHGRNIFFTPDYGWQDFVNGLSFSVPLLLVLTVHEFGHYFTARYHKVDTSLPYYIPIPPIPFLSLSLGTMGAVIQIKEKPNTNVKSFDIGIAGPLAGFVVAILLTVYAFATLPPPEYVFQFHPDYEQFGKNYADTVYTAEFLKYEKQRAIDEFNEKRKNDPSREASDTVNYSVDDIKFTDVSIGNNLAFILIGKMFANPERIPNQHELMHYPFLLACYIALFFTCLNLLPIGQLDGGHVVYGLFGFKKHRIIATIFFVALIFYSGLGLPVLSMAQPKDELVMWLAGYVIFLFFAFRGFGLPTNDTWMYALLMAAAHFVLLIFVPSAKGYHGWLVFAFLVGRFVGIGYPRSEVEVPLDSRRIMIGWIALLIFILCFSPAPFVIQ